MIIFASGTIQFYDRSVFKADSWLWDFGDGDTSTEQNPIHSYGGPGTYDVTLTVTCGAVTSTTSIQVGINFEPFEVILSFEQFTGPIMMPIEWLTSAISGENAIKYAPYANNPNDKNCAATGAPGDVQGVCFTNFSGSSTYDPIGHTFSGQLQCIITGQGSWLNAPFIYPVNPNPTILVGNVPQDLFDHIGDSGAGFSAQQAYDIATQDTLTSIFTTPTNPGRGYFVCQHGGAIYCGNYTTTISYTNPASPSDYGYAPDVFGDPAKTQTVTSYDSGTGTYQGNLSKVGFQVRANVVVPTLQVIFSFLVTPNDSSPPYVVLRQATFHPSFVGQVFTINPDFPRIKDAVTIFEGYQLIPFSVDEDDLEGYVVGLYTVLPPTGQWNTPMGFLATFPNCEAWDDFNDYTGTLGPVNNVGTGGQWADIAGFLSADNQQAYDEFESYAAGSIIFLSNGIGWVTLGGFIVVDNLFCFDDFESYTVGTITSLPIPMNIQNRWIAVGGFLLADNEVGYDDFESYSTGAVSSLNQGSGWSANGAFI